MLIKIHLSCAICGYSSTHSYIEACFIDRVGVEIIIMFFKQFLVD